MTTFDIGASVKVSGEFKDEDGNLQDPTTVTVSYRSPSGTTVSKVYGTDPEVVKDAVGQYHMLISPDENGRWWYRFEATGTGAAADEEWFYVEPQEVA